MLYVPFQARRCAVFFFHANFHTNIKVVDAAFSYLLSIALSESMACDKLHFGFGLCAGLE